MDQTGVAISWAILVLILALTAGIVGWWMWQKKRVERTESWPITEATIESAAVEVVTSSEYAGVELPVFAFSYHVDGHYHSGRFALMPVHRDGSLITRMIGRKLQVRYDPQRVDVWFIPNEYIEGCKVEQKLGPHFVDFSPRN
jgi:hypothetical protein